MPCPSHEGIRHLLKATEPSVTEPSLRYQHWLQNMFVACSAMQPLLTMSLALLRDVMSCLCLHEQTLGHLNASGYESDWL